MTAKVTDKKIKKTGSEEELFIKIDKYFNEKFFFWYVISCMILMPLAEFISELFGVVFSTQPLILLLYGYVGIVACSLKIMSKFRSKSVGWQEIFYITLIVFSAIALALSSDITNSVTGWDYTELPVHFLGYYSLMYSAFQVKSDKLRKIVLYVFMGLAFLEGILGVFQSFGIKIEEVMYGPTTVQIYGLTQNTNFFGTLSVLFVGVGSGMFILCKADIKNRVLLGLLYGLSMYCSFNSMARLAWVGDIGIFFFWLISILIMRSASKKRSAKGDTDDHDTQDMNTALNNEGGVFKRYLLRWLVVMGITVGVILLSFLHSDAPLERVTKSMDEINMLQEDNTDDFGSNRGYIWRFVLQSVPKHWATGIGLDNLRMCFTENPEWQEGDYYQNKAHNEYIHTLATQGVFALLNYLTLLVVSAVVAIKRIIHTKDETDRVITWIVMAMFTGYLLQAMFSSSIINVAMYFWVTIGLLNPVGRKKSAEIENM